MSWLALVALLRLAARLVASVVRHPLMSAALGVLTLVTVEYGRRGTLGVLALTALALVGWLWRWPADFKRRFALPARGFWRWATFYAWRWYGAMTGAKLVLKAPDRRVFKPKITRITSTGVVDTLHVSLMYGHTPQAFFEQAETLRHSFKAYRLAVIEDSPGRIRLRIFARDPLSVVVPAVPVEQVPQVPDLAALLVGVSESGRAYLLRLEASHTLVAGATGAGKGSVLWSIIRALGPGIRSGLVRVAGIDPKGGMELHPGRPLFAYYADESAQEMVAALEAAVTRMTLRRFGCVTPDSARSPRVLRSRSR